MKIKNIFGEDITYRPCIGAVLDALYNDFTISPTLEMKNSKLSTWHLALEDLTDKAIASGYKKTVSEKLNYIPNSGVFKGYCIQPPKSKFYEPKPEIEFTPEESKEMKKKEHQFFKRYGRDNEEAKDEIQSLGF